MRIDVKYTKDVYAQKGLTIVTQTGLELTDNILPGDVISLFAINKKVGFITTNLKMEIPKENIQDVIDALKQFL